MTPKPILVSFDCLKRPAFICAKSLLLLTKYSTLIRSHLLPSSTRGLSSTQCSGVSLICLCFCTSFHLQNVSVSLSLKVRSHRGRVTEGNLKMWKDQLTSRSHLLSMNIFEIECLKNGLLFGKAIDLPRELRFNTVLMQEMLVPPDPSSTVTVRYFTHLRLIL